MAQHQPGNKLGVVSKTKATAGSAASSGNIVGTPANYFSETSINARLTAINATLYSAANLDKMTLNDKIYALRVLDDSGTI